MLPPGSLLRGERVKKGRRKTRKHTQKAYLDSLFVSLFSIACVVYKRKTCVFGVEFWCFWPLILLGTSRTVFVFSFSLFFDSVASFLFCVCDNKVLLSTRPLCIILFPCPLSLSFSALSLSLFSLSHRTFYPSLNKRIVVTQRRDNNPQNLVSHIRRRLQATDLQM